MAGLGCIGKNNMLVTPDFGPRVRLRAALVGIKLPTTGPVDFNPCQACGMPCRKACPQKAFQNKIHIDNPLGLAELPGRDGVYSRSLCLHQMDIDRQNASNNENGNQKGPDSQQVRVAKCCRLCETSCPIGRK
jgi:epoxyqueuosine reductase